MVAYPKWTVLLLLLVHALSSGKMTSLADGRPNPFLMEKELGYIRIPVGRVVSIRTGSAESFSKLVSECWISACPSACRWSVPVPTA